MKKSLFSHSVVQLASSFHAGEVSAEEIVTTFLRRIEKHDEQVGAFLSVYSKEAAEQARALDQRRRRGEKLGKLAAVPLAIKDNIHIRGKHTTCASRFLEGYKAPFDATVIDLLREEDAIFLGKTNLDEFAMGSSNEYSALKQTVNPWKRECVPGGSSGGSAAAVSARLVPAALGSDTGGSIRLPASFCGIAGLKPTYGRISRYGLVAFGSSLDQIGPMAHSVEDLALLLDVLGRPCSRDSTSISHSSPSSFTALRDPICKMSVGVPHSLLEGMNGEVEKCFREALLLLQEQGVDLVEIDFEWSKYWIPVYYVLATAEASTNLARFDGVRYGRRSPQAQNLEELYCFSRGQGFGKEVKRRIFLGTCVLSRGCQDGFYQQALRVRTQIVREYERLFSICDCIVTPTVPTVAFQRGDLSKDPLSMYLQDVFTAGQNLAGVPAVTLPCGFSSASLPIGLQFTGPQLGEEKILRLAYHYEQLSDWHERCPPAFVEEGEV